MTTKQIMQHQIWPKARLFADRYEMIKHIATKSKITHIAEIGVANGQFSRFLLDECSPNQFDAYDIFELHKVEKIWGIPSKDMFNGKTHFEFYHDKFEKEISAGQFKVMNGDSSSLLNSSNSVYDLIYIDGDHTLEGVKADMLAALRKINNGGILVFNDYIAYDHFGQCSYGIVENVNNLLASGDWKIMGFAFQQNMFCDIALSKSAHPWL